MRSPEPHEADPRDYPEMAAVAGRVEPAPRRVRGFVAGQQVFDTTRAHYVWEWPYYPQYLIPHDAVVGEFLEDEGHVSRQPRGTARRHGLRVGDVHRPGTAHVYDADAVAGMADTVRFEWDALDAWFEEDEEIFVHPRNPYVRVDALRSQRHVRVELDGVVLAETRSPVLLFETGLPTRYYLDRTDVHFEHLLPSPTSTSCPYKGTTSDYWSVRVGDEVHEDLAWGYDFPTDAARPVAGMVAFYNEKLDIVLDGERLTRPRTHFAK